jgi:iron-sulfur cluster assembly accessory protein
MLRLTDAAVARAKALAELHGCPPVVRVRVIGGGCSGLTWDLELGEVGVRDGDIPRTTDGVTVLVDGVSAAKLRGAVVDVGAPSATGLRPRTDDGETEFVVRGLPAKATCSCGESFTEDSVRRDTDAGG